MGRLFFLFFNGDLWRVYILFLEKGGRVGVWVVFLLR